MPQGVLRGPLTVLKTLLSKCPTFQALVGAADETEALASIFKYTIRTDLATRPWALIDREACSATEIAGGVTSTFGHGGSLSLVIEAGVTEEDEVAAMEAHEETLEAIVKEMEERSGTDGCLAIEGIEIGPSILASLVEEVANGEDYIATEIEVRW